MSAQVSFPDREMDGQGLSLSLVPSTRSTVSTVGFGLIIMAVLALGLGLVMIVTTSVATQSQEISALRVEATELEYSAANLTTQLQQKSNTASLAMRATDAGMVPNPNPVFIRLSDNSILGEPKPVVGDEAPFLRRPAPPVVVAPAEASGNTLPVAPVSNQ